MNATSLPSSPLYTLLMLCNRTWVTKLLFVLTPSVLIWLAGRSLDVHVYLGPLLILSVLSLQSLRIAVTPLKITGPDNWTLSITRVAVMLLVSVTIIAVLPAPENNLQAILHSLIVTERMQVTVFSAVCLTIAGPLLSYRFWGESPGVLFTLFRATAVVTGYLTSIALVLLTGNGYNLVAVGHWIGNQPLNGIDLFIVPVMALVGWFIVKAFILLFRRKRGEHRES